MKTAIVTGGGTGIGLATAARLTVAGYRVVAGGLDREDVLPDGVEFHATDVTSTADLTTLVAAAGDRIDALVNCAGVILHEREWEIDAFRLVLDVNVTACLALARLALPGLEAAQGAVVNIASMWSFFGAAGTPAYGASKGAIVALTRSMATAWGRKGIRVNAVAPGWVETRLSLRAQADPERARGIGARIPLGRWAQPSEIAAVIHFLLSPEASYVHGAVLPVDGGYAVA